VSCGRTWDRGAPRRRPRRDLRARIPGWTEPRKTTDQSRTRSGVRGSRDSARVSVTRADRRHEYVARVPAGRRTEREPDVVRPRYGPCESRDHGPKPPRFRKPAVRPDDRLAAR